MSILDATDTYFEITKRGSTYTQEVRGGIATFLTMSYILLVNPQVLTAWIRTDDNSSSELKDLKDDFSKDIATATAITCGLGCVMVGVLARMPFAVGPGMGLNTLVAGLLVTVRSEAELADAKQVWGEVAATTFLVGVVLTLLSGVGLVSPAIAAMPDTIKTSIMVGIGAYQAFIGMREMGIVAKSETDYVSIEDFPSFKWDDRKDPTSAYAQLLFVLSLALTTVFFLKGVKGSILLGIVFCTAVCWIGDIGGSSFPVPPVAAPTFSHTFLKVYFETWFKDVGTYLPQLFVILLITIFDCGGVQFGIAKLLNLPAIYKELDQKRDATLQGEVSVSVSDGEYSGPKRRPSMLGSLMEKAARVGDAIQEHGLKEKLEKQLAVLNQLEENDYEGIVDIVAVKDEVKARLVSVADHTAECPETSPLLNPGSPHSSAHHGQLLPGRCSQLTFVTVGVMNMIGAVFGSSPNIIFLECAAGVKEGARTGFCSVVTGALFLVTVVLTPVFQNVPLCASAGPLVFVGCLMMSHVGEIQWGDLRHALPAFLTILMMPFTSSITPGIGFGLGYYLVLRGMEWVYERVARFLTKGRDPLHKAAKGDVGGFNEQLTRHRDLLNAADSEGCTPLHIAAVSGKQEIVQILLDAGASTSLVNNHQRTALQEALQCAKGRRTAVVALLQAH